MNRASLILILLALLCTGCGGSSWDIVSVSGTVTLDGEALPNATVIFTPLAQGGSDAGPSSTGTTDADGKFTLMSAEGIAGAVVGKHQVRITTVTDEGGDGASDDVYSDEGNGEKLPARYNAASTLEFDVPAGGSTAANFDATSTKDVLDTPN